MSDSAYKLGFDPDIKDSKQLLKKYRMMAFGPGKQNTRSYLATKPELFRKKTGAFVSEQSEVDGIKRATPGSISEIGSRESKPDILKQSVAFGKCLPGHPHKPVPGQTFLDRQERKMSAANPRGQIDPIVRQRAELVGYTPTNHIGVAKESKLEEMKRFIRRDVPPATGNFRPAVEKIDGKLDLYDPGRPSPRLDRTLAPKPPDTLAHFLGTTSEPAETRYVSYVKPGTRQGLGGQNISTSLNEDVMRQTDGLNRALKIAQPKFRLVTRTNKRPSEALAGTKEAPPIGWNEALDICVIDCSIEEVETKEADGWRRTGQAWRVKAVDDMNANLLNIEIGGSQSRLLQVRDTKRTPGDNNLRMTFTSTKPWLPKEASANLPESRLSLNPQVVMEKIQSYFLGMLERSWVDEEAQSQARPATDAFGTQISQEAAMLHIDASQPAHSDLLKSQEQPYTQVVEPDDDLVVPFRLAKSITDDLSPIAKRAKCVLSSANRFGQILWSKDSPEGRLFL